MNFKLYFLIFNRNIKKLKNILLNIKWKHIYKNNLMCVKC